MAADQGLIQASLKEALSRVGPDKTKFYESQVATPLATSASMANIFQKKNEEKQKAWDDIAEPVEVMMRKLASGSDQLGGMHPANVARLKELQKEFNAAYGDKEKEDKIKFKIEQVASEINVIAAGFGKFGQSYIDGTLNVKESNPEFYKSFGKIWDVDGVYDDVEFSWDENNKMSVTIGSETQKVTDLFKGLVPDDSAPSIGLGNLGVKATKWNTWDDKTFKRGALEYMKTKESYANLIGKDTFGDVSFKEALATLFDNDEKNDNPDIAGIMKDLGLDDDIKNKNILYDAITNIHDKNFNLEQARSVVAQWYTEGYGKAKFLEGEKARSGTSDNNNDGNSVNDDDKGNSINLGRDRLGVWLGWIPKIDIDDKIKEIDGASKVGTKVEHLRDSSIYAELIGGGGDSFDDPRGVGEKMFEIYVQGKKRKDGPFTIDQVKNIFKVGKTPQGR